jgi:hypothetical protein
VESVAFFIGLSIAAIGVFATVTSEALLWIIRYLVTPVGLYLVAGFRIATGVIFFQAAPASRTPRILRVLGSIIFISGLITPFIGSERARAIVDWWSAQGSLAMRAWAAVAILLGAFVAYTVSSGRRADGRNDAA